MGRVILGMDETDTRKSDHENCNTLDNRRRNLRIATNSQNGANRERLSNNTSGYKGVSWDKRRRKWHAYIYFNKKQIHLGFFDTAEQAYEAYCAAAIRLHGEFARLV